MIKGLFFSILLNGNGFVILIINEIDELFRGADEAFKSPINKLRPIFDLFSWKPTESVGYDVVQLHRLIILSEDISRSAK